MDFFGVCTIEEHIYSLFSNSIQSIMSKLPRQKHQVKISCIVIGCKSNVAAVDLADLALCLFLPRCRYLAALAALVEAAG